MDTRPPRDNIVRAVFPGAEVRETTDGNGTLFGHFAKFNEWTRIDSVFEGKFMERIAPGSFAKTFQEGRSLITLNHGKDPELGDKPIAAPEVLREDEQGAYYEAPLLDGVPPLVLSGLRAGQYGASFRFRVTREDLDRKAKVSDYNPDGLPERTIREVELFEFGPVTYPAYAGATAGVRSLTDDYYRDLIRPDAPSVDAGAPPHLEPERRDPEPTPPIEQEHTVDDKYTSREDKASRVAELKEGLERQASEYPGVMPVEAQARWDADNRELDALEADIRAWDARQVRVASLLAEEKVDKGYQPTEFNTHRVKSQRDIYSFDGGTFRNTEERDQELRDDAMRATELARFPDAVDADASRDKIANLLEYHDSPDKELARRIKATGSPLYRRAFEKVIKSRGTLGLTPEEQRGTALAVGVDATGGFTVPFAFDPTIIAIGSWSGAVNPYRRVARVVPIVGTDTWNAITSTAVVATRTTEAAASVEQGPTFAQPQYVVKRVQGQITASFEMFQDRADLASEMATLIQEAKDNEEETSFATGAGGATASIGVGPVNGTSGAYTSITTAASVTLAAADADAVEAALPVRHRFGAQWFLNRTSIRRFQTLETAGGKLFGGQQYQAVGVPAIDAAGNTGLRLLGYAVNESPSLPTAQTANIVIGTLLAPNSYVIVERVGMSVQFIPFILNSSSLATGQQALYFMWRNHAAPINVDAGRTLRYLT
jgi:HK97 family phage major capsid protein